MVLVAERLRRRIVVPVYVGSIPTEHPEITGSRGMVYLACIGGRSMSVRVRSSRQGIDGKSSMRRHIRIFVVHTPREVQLGYE